MRRPDYTRRVAVTGLGIVSPVGPDIPTAWTNLVDGQFRPASHHLLGPLHLRMPGCRRGATTSTPTPGWTSRRSAAPTRTSSSAWPRPSRRWPTPGLEVDDANSEDVGVIFGSGVRRPGPDGGRQSDHEDTRPRSVSPFFIANMLPDTASGQIAIETGHPRAEHVHRDRLLDRHPQHRRGGRGHPARRLHRRHHRLHRDARCSRSATSASATCAAWARRARARRSTTVSRPFDRDPQRLRAGRGRRRAWCSRTSSCAKARGAKVYAEVVGYGSAADAWDLIQPIEKGDGTRRAMEMALERHGVPRDEIDLINPHGTSTPLGDLREAQAHLVGLRRAHPGDRHQRHQVDDRPPDGRGRRRRGHLHGPVRPPPDARRRPSTTASPIPEINLDVVHGASRPMEIRYAMSDNIGLGGHNGAVIFKRYDGD